jgi:hypothetical protein
MARGDEVPRKKSGPMTGLSKRTRRSEATAAATVEVLGCGGSGFKRVTDAQRYIARQGLAKRFPDSYRSAEDVNRVIQDSHLPDAHWEVYTQLIAQA